MSHTSTNTQSANRAHIEPPICYKTYLCYIMLKINDSVFDFYRFYYDVPKKTFVTKPSYDYFNYYDAQQQQNYTQGYDFVFWYCCKTGETN